MHHGPHPDPCPACGFRPRSTSCAFCGREIPRHTVTWVPDDPRLGDPESIPEMPMDATLLPKPLHRLWQWLLDHAPFTVVAVAAWLAFILVVATWR